MSRALFIVKSPIGEYVRACERGTVVPSCYTEDPAKARKFTLHYARAVARRSGGAVLVAPTPSRP